MPITDTQAGPGSSQSTKGASPSPMPEYHFTLTESPGLFTSLRENLREWRRNSNASFSSPYYRGEVALPVTEMRPWYRDFRSQIKSLFEKPTEPIGIFNRAQEKKRALCGGGGAMLGAGVAYALGGPSRIV